MARVSLLNGLGPAGAVYALIVSSVMTSPAVAQGFAAPEAPRTDIQNVAPRQSTIIPTDTLPSQSISGRTTFGENLQLRILQALPTRLYLTGTVESSVRIETNVFQFPTKRQLIRQLPQGADFFRLSPFQKQQVSNILALASREDTVFRILPNLTAGWTFTPRTRVFCNYFFLRDSLAHNVQLNTNINSLAYGVQQDFPIGSKSNLQAEMQFRNLWQTNQLPVFDFLPGITLTSVITPRTVAFVNCLLQLRGTGYFKSPNREIDPFYTWGLLHQRGGWTFSASSTFVQNFREPFAEHATIPINNYAMISDFEIARRPFKQIPGLQFGFRAEPIWNMAAQRTPGLSGFDFRGFFFTRFSAAKPSLQGTMEQLRQQIQEQENQPTPPTPVEPGGGGGGKDPTTSIPAYEPICHIRQPVHGSISMADGVTDDGPAFIQQGLFSRPVADQKIASDANEKEIERAGFTSPQETAFLFAAKMAHPRLVVAHAAAETPELNPVFSNTHIVQTLFEQDDPAPRIYLVPPMPAVDMNNRNQPFTLAGDGDNPLLHRPLLKVVR